MPSTFKLKDFESQKLQYRIANIEDNTYPYVDDRLPDKDITLQTRGAQSKDPYVRHTLVGINLFVQEMFLTFDEPLGIRTFDPMVINSKPSVTAQGLALAEQATIDLARHETATVSVVSTTKTATDLVVTVQVTNNAGHSFPSGVSFRRAFLDFAVLDSNKKPLWESGATNEYGEITNGPGGPVLPTELLKDGEYQKDHAEIHDQSQVQIYEELVKNTDGHFTTSFLSLYDTVKKNRLLPQGWSPSGPHASETKPIGLAVRNPPDKAGYSTIVYKIPLTKIPNAATVRADLYYQSIPPYYLKQRFTDTYNPEKRTVAENTQRLMDFVAALPVAKTEIHDWKLFVTGATSAVTK